MHDIIYCFGDGVQLLSTLAKHAFDAGGMQGHPEHLMAGRILLPPPPIPLLKLKGWALM